MRQNLGLGVLPSTNPSPLLSTWAWDSHDNVFLAFKRRLITVDAEYLMRLNARKNQRGSGTQHCLGYPHQSDLQVGTMDLWRIRIAKLRPTLAIQMSWSTLLEGCHSEPRHIAVG